MPSAESRRHAGELFGEKDFYLDEFRGRSVLVAVAPRAAAARPDLRALAAATADLVRNDTRVLVWWPDVGAAAARRLRTALARVRGGTQRPAASPVRVQRAVLGRDDVEALRAELWRRLRSDRLSVVIGPADDEHFRRAPAALAVALRIPRLILLDAQGGLVPGGPDRLSFVDANVLDTLLRQGEAEWSGLGDRRDLLVAVRDALRDGIESVSLCTPEGIGEELFTYQGSGTLFTRGDYCRVERLAVDDFAQAERLLERGQREGLLKLRSPDEIAQVLAVGFGAMVCDRHLAGVAGLLTAPYVAERAGEIVGLYTITRFKGEGLGERLVSRLLAEADDRGLAYVFACAVDERAVQFFVRLGFARVGADEVPAAKWVGYDARRRARVAVLRRTLAKPAAAVHG